VLFRSTEEVLTDGAAGRCGYTHAASGVNLRCEVFVDQIDSLEILHQTLNVYVGHRSALKMEGCVRLRACVYLRRPPVCAAPPHR
jgi:hypothetical protein